MGYPRVSDLLDEVDTLKEALRMARKNPEEPIATALGPCRIDLAIKALEEGCQLRSMHPYYWHVTSGNGPMVYIVSRDPADLHYICTCTAGENDLDCKHVALVQIIEATGAGPPILPPPPERGY